MTDFLFQDYQVNQHYSLLDQFFSGSLALSLDKLFKLRWQEREAAGEKVIESDKSQGGEAEKINIEILLTHFWLYFQSCFKISLVLLSAKSDKIF